MTARPDQRPHNNEIAAWPLARPDHQAVARSCQAVNGIDSGDSGHQQHLFSAMRGMKNSRGEKLQCVSVGQKSLSAKTHACIMRLRASTRWLKWAQYVARSFSGMISSRAEWKAQ